MMPNIEVKKKNHGGKVCSNAIEVWLIDECLHNSLVSCSGFCCGFSWPWHDVCGLSGHRDFWLGMAMLWSLLDASEPSGLDTG